MLKLLYQITTREQKAKPALEAVVDKVQRVLERVCKEVNRQAKLYQVREGGLYLMAHDDLCWCIDCIIKPYVL